MTTNQLQKQLDDQQVDAEGQAFLDELYELVCQQNKQLEKVLDK
jgi:hypothetical protein